MTKDPVIITKIIHFGNSLSACVLSAISNARRHTGGKCLPGYIKEKVNIRIGNLVIILGCKSDLVTYIPNFLRFIDVQHTY